jgi:hypothetical protein
MLSIEITEQVATRDDLSLILRGIADMIAMGHDSGFHPEWSISGDEEENNDLHEELEPV